MGEERSTYSSPIKSQVGDDRSAIVRYRRRQQPTPTVLRSSVIAGPRAPLLRRRPPAAPIFLAISETEGEVRNREGAVRIRES